MNDNGQPVDVTDHEAARMCVDGVLADRGRIDVLVDHAGRGAVATVEDRWQPRARRDPVLDPVSCSLESAP
jgi:NAD(P)-dependent dehydrogenase (short-subunit alcohol dehydrogenase family)